MNVGNRRQVAPTRPAVPPITGRDPGTDGHEKAVVASGAGKEIQQEIALVAALIRAAATTIDAEAKLTA